MRVFVPFGNCDVSPPTYLHIGSRRSVLDDYSPNFPYRVQENVLRSSGISASWYSLVVQFRFS